MLGVREYKNCPYCPLYQGPSVILAIFKGFLFEVLLICLPVWLFKMYNSFVVALSTIGCIHSCTHAHSYMYMCVCECTIRMNVCVRKMIEYKMNVRWLNIYFSSINWPFLLWFLSFFKLKPQVLVFWNKAYNIFFILKIWVIEWQIMCNAIPLLKGHILAK